MRYLTLLFKNAHVYVHWHSLQRSISMWCFNNFLSLISSCWVVRWGEVSESDVRHSSYLYLQVTERHRLWLLRNVLTQILAVLLVLLYLSHHKVSNACWYGYLLTRSVHLHDVYHWIVLMWWLLIWISAPMSAFLDLKSFIHGYDHHFCL